MPPRGKVVLAARDESGLSSVEYTVLLVLIVTSTAPLWRDLGNAIKRKLRCAAESFDVQLQDKCEAAPDEASGGASTGSGV
jgi:Flp pilus assembly pilin Flp